MFLFAKLAWRNVLRNKRRTILAGLAIGIGIAALIFSDAFVIGMMQTMIEGATDTFIGEAQINRPGYEKTLDVDLTIENPQNLFSILKEESYIKAYAPRLQSFAMISSPANVASANLIGIEPQKESQVTSIKKAVIKGNYISGSDEHKILIGSKLAEDLEVSINDKVVITVAQAHTGELSQEMFRIAGIFQFGTPEIDGRMAFVPLSKMQKMLNLPNAVHTVALKFVDLSMASDKNLPIWKKIANNGLTLRSWKQIMPELDAALQMTDFSVVIIAFILFGVVAFGIMNALFMSLYERMFEFGVLKALGTRPYKLAELIILEAAWLAVISAVIGVVIGFLVTYYFVHHGIDYAGIEFAGVTMQHMLYPVLRLEQFIVYPVELFVFTVVVALYPAWYAWRLTPAKAMKKSL